MNGIYLARAYTDYGTVYETECIETVQRKYPNSEIISLPNIEKLEHDKQNIKYGIGLFNKEKEHFFKLIDNCDTLIITSIDNEFNKDGSRRKDKGKLSEGVKIEALYALSIGKKIYTLDIHKDDKDKFIEIRNISDSEELITEIVKLNNDKHNLLKEYPKIKNLIKTEKRLNIHQKMMDFYSKNPSVRSLMKNFMSSNRNDIEYVRPIVIQEKYPILQNPIDYLPWGTKANYELNDLTTNKEKVTTEKYNINDLVGEIHFRECIFDKGVKDAKLIDKEINEVVSKLLIQNKKVKNFKPWMIFNKHVIGASIVFDIDSPHELEEKVGKVNMFDENQNWYKEFMIMKCAAEEWFDSQNLRCVSFTTGNGFNIVSEPYWFDKNNDNLYDFKDDIDYAIDKINKLHINECKGVTIDTYPITWHVYKKMPFTYHTKWNRITFPVTKGRIDKEWLKKLSDLDYFLSNPKHIDEVIKKCGWDKDKWW